MSMQLLRTYFPDLYDTHFARFEALEDLYRSWNTRINVISRKDIDQLYLHHVLHSLALSQVVQFEPGAQVLDLGTGGGFPGIPMAILFPETNFHLIDGTRKKITVVQAVADALGLTNVQAEQQRAESLRQARYDFVITRAVASALQLTEWAFPLIRERQQHALPNGLLALKGGDLRQELKALPRDFYVEQYDIHEWFCEDWYEQKYVVYIQA